MPRPYWGDMFKQREAELMNELDRRAYREATPIISQFMTMRLPLTLRGYVSRLHKLYEAMAGSKFIPMKITPETWIGNAPTQQEDAYARELLTELYSLMSPTKKPRNRNEYERDVERAAYFIAATTFYFPLPQPVQGQGDARQIAEKVIKKLQTEMGQNS